MNRRRDSAWYRLRGNLRVGLAGLLLRLLGGLSLPGAQRLGRVIGWLFWVINGKTRRTVEDNLARCLPELDTDERARLARRSLIETGMGLIETGTTWRWPCERIEPIVTGMSGFEQIERTLEAGQGAILLAPHMGSWELGGLMTGIRTPTTVMYRPPREPAMEALLVELRSGFGSDMAPANLGGVRKALRALKRGELVAILPD